MFLLGREILFKAKRKNWEELPKEQWWIEGDLIHEHFGTCIQVTKDRCRSKYKVDESTICQYTGLIDKNGKKIWENDICVIHSIFIDEEDGCFAIKWDDDTASYILSGGFIFDFDNYHGNQCEIIGNVFDNPELLAQNRE